jgi:hypothetical protein
MTVSTQTITAGPYNGNDVADTFAYTWRITDKNQVIVIETDDLGVETQLTVDTDYRVEGIGDEGGGSVTKVVSTIDTALATDYQWYMRSNFLPTQDTNFDNQGAFFPENHEDAFDKLTRLIQQTLYSGGQTLAFNDNEYFATFNPALPSPISDGYLKVTADGTAMEWVANTSGFDVSDNYDFTGTLQHNGNDVYSSANIYLAVCLPTEDATAAIDILPAHQSGGIVTTSGTAVAITIQPFATQALPVGSVVPVYQSGAGTVTFVAGAGVTIEKKATEGLVMTEQYAFATAWHRSLNIWVLSGNLQA